MGTRGGSSETEQKATAIVQASRTWFIKSGVVPWKVLLSGQESRMHTHTHTHTHTALHRANTQIK